MTLNAHASGSSVIGVVITFTVLAAAFVAGRSYARLRVARNFGSDDVAIVFAMVFAVGTTITMLFQVRYGIGSRQASLSHEDTKSLLQAFYVSIWMYNLSLSGTKIAILLQYLRVFGPVRVFRICCWTLLGIVVICSLYIFFTAVFACIPISSFWDRTIEGKCLPRFPIWFSNAGINIATDIAIAILPIPVLSNLELPTRTKRALITVFLLGGFTCIVSILRLQSLHVISRASDVSWHNSMAAIWSSIEMNTAIMCSCLPTLRCIFPNIFKSRISQPRSCGSGRPICSRSAGHGGMRMKVLTKLHLQGSKSSRSDGSVEAGNLDRKYSFPPRTDIHSGDQFRGELGGSRMRGLVGEADGRILVSKAIEQEIDIREEEIDDYQSTKDLIMRHL